MINEYPSVSSASTDSINQETSAAGPDTQIRRNRRLSELFGGFRTIIKTTIVLGVLTLGTSIPLGSIYAVTIGEQCTTSSQCDSSDGACCPLGNESVCTDLSRNPFNCGSCGNVCQSTEYCIDSTCICAGEGGSLNVCANGESCLPGVGCVDYQSDPENCGSASNACGPGETCIAGQCTCGELTAETAVCGGGSACCGSPASCKSEDQCACGTLLCGQGQECCSANGYASCTNVDSNQLNCGVCGNACSNNLVCQTGICDCPTGYEQCGGECVDISRDADHCGACGETCPEGFACNEGRCELSCPYGQINCDGKCVSLETDSNNCGTCGYVCDDGERCDGLGQCEVSCLPNQTYCDGKCVDFETDSNHCGTCRNTCSTGESCDNGVCAPSCLPGQVFCGGQCVSLETDSNNCGTCGYVCDDGERCDGLGQCEVSCQDGLTECGGVCRDLAIDPRHCGTCGNECQAGEICVDGGCTPMGISAFDAAPSLFIPYWTTRDEQETILVISSVKDAVVNAAFFDGQGNFILVEEYNLSADELLSVKLADLGLTGDGSVVVKSMEVNGVAPSITAETIVRGGKKDEVYSFSPANALKGVWTTFAPAWHGSYGSLEYDELYVFGPGSELAVELESLAILPGRPAHGYPSEIIVKIFDDLGFEIAHAIIPLESVTRIDLRQIADVTYGGPGTLQVFPALDIPDSGEPIRRRPDPTDYVFISYLKRHLDNEIKIGKEAVKSGYLFSETPEITR